MYGSSWRLFRGFGAMNGFRGGAGTPVTGFEEAGDPSNGVPMPWVGAGMGTAGCPAVWPAEGAAHAKGAASIAVITISRAPQALWRILRRAYGRLRGEWIRSRSSSSWPATS